MRGNGPVRRRVPGPTLGTNPFWCIPMSSACDGERLQAAFRRAQLPWALGFLRGAVHLSFTLSPYDILRMDSDYDPRREAEAAMQRAVRADGFERQRWILLAQAWLELARTGSFDPRPSGRSG